MTRNSLAALGLTSLVALGLAAGARAQTVTITNTETIETGGPYTSNKYLDITGSGQKYPSYGLVSIDTAGFSNVDSVSSLSLTLTNSYSSKYSTDGLLDFYLESDTTTTNSLTYKAGVSAPARGAATGGVGIDTTQFTSGSSLYFLGSGDYVAVTTPTYAPETYTFAPNNATSSYLADVLNNSGDLRLLIAVDASNPSTFDEATFSGSGTTFTGENPTISVTPAAPAPEPSSVVSMILGVGVLGSIAVRRRYASSK